jgi:hypothetical protein
MNVNLVWTNEYPKQLEETVLALVKSECQYLLLCGLDDPSQLGFHLVFLSEDTDNGNAVRVYGMPEDKENFYCEYIPTLEWGPVENL